MGYGGGTTVLLLFFNLIQYLGGGGIGIGWKLENIIHNTTTNKYGLQHTVSLASVMAGYTRKLTNWIRGKKKFIRL